MSHILCYSILETSNSYDWREILIAMILRFIPVYQHQPHVNILSLNTDFKLYVICGNEIDTFEHPEFKP